MKNLLPPGQAEVPEPAPPRDALPGKGEPLAQRVRSLRLPPDAAARRGGRLWTALLLLAIAAAGGLAWRWFRPATAGDLAATSAPAAGAAPAGAAASTAAPPASSQQPAGAAAGTIALESKGYIVPARQILLSPKISGMIQRLAIVEGQRVTKGEVLAELENTDYRADVDRVKAVLAASRQRLAELERGFRPEEIRQTEAELGEAEAQLAQHKADYARAKELRAKNVISVEEFDAADSRYHAMEQRCERLRFALTLMRQGPRVERIEIARAEVAQAEAELSKANWRLENTIIRAPISGTILKKNAEEGNIVNPIAFNGSFSICEMADLADLEVDLSIQERDIARVFPGQKCTVRPEAFPDRGYEGAVSRLMPIADRAKGAISVRVKVTVPAAEEGVYLKPEMSVIVTFFSKAGPLTPP